MAVRWALIGPGRHAERSVVPQIAKAAGGELVAVMSRDAARGAAFARQHGIAKVHASFEAVLADPGIDAIYDATPDGLHAPHAIAAARAGKHALVEKPLAISVADGVQAIAACRRHGVRLGVVFNQRHEAAHQEARRIVARGGIGTPLLATVQISLRVAQPAAGTAPSWRADRSLRAGGIATSIGDHACDTLAYLLGERIEEVAAFAAAAGADGRGERVAGMLLRLTGGAIGYAAASFETPFAEQPFEIHGTKGSLIVAHSYAYLTGGGGGPAPALTIIDEAGTRTQQFTASECFRLEVEQFNRAIAGDGEPMTPAAEGLRALAITDAVYAAIAGGRTAKVGDFLPAP